jgi:hypothetical protein
MVILPTKNRTVSGLTPDRFFRVIRQLLNIFLVAIVHRNWKKAVEAGKYDSQFNYISPEFTEADLPQLDEAEVGCEVSMRQKNEDKDRTTQAWRDGLENDQDSKDRFAHPLKVLAIGYDEATKDEQRNDPIFTTWISPRTGLLWYLILHGDAGRRNLNVLRDSPHVEWNARYRAAVVAKVLKPSGN